MSVIFVIVLYGAFIKGEELEVREIRPECGATHCTITVEEAEAILRGQAILADGYERASKSCRVPHTRGGNT